MQSDNSELLHLVIYIIATRMSKRDNKSQNIQ
jgi:hypothetical protein